MPGSTFKSAAHKIRSGSHLFRFAEIVHAFWHRNICPTFSRLHFVGPQFSVSFTSSGNINEQSVNSLWGKRSPCSHRVFLYLSWITPFSLFLYHQHRIKPDAPFQHIFKEKYLRTYLQEKGIPWAALDSGFGLWQAGRAMGFQPLYRATTQGSSPVKHLGGCPIYFQRQIFGLNLAF